MYNVFSRHSHMAPGACVYPGLANAGRSGHASTCLSLNLMAEFLTHIIMKSVIKSILVSIYCGRPL